MRVVDLTRLLPGDFATWVLADLGAEVIKVEDVAGGDYMRWMPPLVGHSSAMFWALNRGKRCIKLDLKQEAGREGLLKLACGADDRGARRGAPRRLPGRLHVRGRGRFHHPPRGPLPGRWRARRAGPDAPQRPPRLLPPLQERRRPLDGSGGPGAQVLEGLLRD